LPGASLGPTGALDRTRADLWMQHCDHELFPAIKAVAQAAATDKAPLVAALEGKLMQLEHPAYEHGRLGPFWNGQGLGLVDVGYQVLFDTLRRSEAWAGGTVALPSWFADWATAVGAHPTIIQAQAIAGDLQRAGA
jgi:hypothetical protein